MVKTCGGMHLIYCTWFQRPKYYLHSLPTNAFNTTIKIMKLPSPIFCGRKLIFSAALLFICFYNLSAVAQENTASLKQKLDATIDSLYTSMQIPGVSVAIITPQLNYKK